MSCCAAHRTTQLQGLTDMLVLLLQVTDEQLDEMVSQFVAAAQAAQQADGGAGDGAHLTLAGFLAASEQSQVSIGLTPTAHLLVAPVSVRVAGGRGCRNEPASHRQKGFAPRLLPGFKDLTVSQGLASSVRAALFCCCLGARSQVPAQQHSVCKTSGQSRAG